jgi:hypothetical protein
VPRKTAVKISMVLVLGLATAFLAINTLLYNDDKPIITGPGITQFSNEFASRFPRRTRIQQSFWSVVRYIASYQYAIAPNRLDIFEGDYYQQLFHNDFQYIKEIEWVNSFVSEGKPLVILMDARPLEYALFGINVTRSLFPVNDLFQKSEGQYLLVENSLSVTPSGLTLIASDDQFSIYR